MVFVVLVVLGALAGFDEFGVAGVLAAPLPLVGAPVVPTGVAAGVDGGNDVSGVGSGGSGFERTFAINSFIPVNAVSA